MRICIFHEATWRISNSKSHESDAENIVGDIQITEPADAASVTGRHNSRMVRVTDKDNSDWRGAVGAGRISFRLARRLATVSRNIERERSRSTLRDVTSKSESACDDEAARMPRA